MMGELFNALCKAVALSHFEKEKEQTPLKQSARGETIGKPSIKIQAQVTCCGQRLEHTK